MPTFHDDLWVEALYAYFHDDLQVDVSYAYLTARRA